MRAAIYGVAGFELTEEERAFLRDAEPAGMIIFRRNCDTPEQLLRLTDALREITGRGDLPILIDQEGGRVARMRPPAWPAFPAAERFARLYEAAPSSAIEAVRSNARALGLMLRSCGINVNCLPLLDVRQEGATDIIGDRALGSEPIQVAALGRAVLDGMASAGVVGVIKHIPGHGRTMVDSHHDLPRVTASRAELSRTDFVPFKRLADLPWGMTAHILYEAIDPEQPATLSAKVISDIIRGEIGFDGLLLSDDLSMKALRGGLGDLARRSVAAGCDIALHCNGKMEEMVEVAAGAPPLSKAGLERYTRGRRQVGKGQPVKLDQVAKELTALLA